MDVTLLLALVLGANVVIMALVTSLTTINRNFMSALLFRAIPFVVMVFTAAFLVGILLNVITVENRLDPALAAEILN